MLKIKVAYICTPIEFGGAERVSFNFFQFINREKFDITPIFLIRPWESKPLLALSAEEMGYNPIYIPVATNRHDNYFRIFRVSVELLNIFREYKFDIIHSHGYFTDICSLLIARIMNIPCLSTCHGYINNNFKLKLYNFFDKIFLFFASKIIVVSDTVGDELKLLKYFRKSIVICPNAVPLLVVNKVKIADDSWSFSGIDRDHSKTTIGYVGRLSREKGVVFLLAAFVHDILKNSDVRLVVIGEGDESTSLKQSAKEFGIADRVFFLGFQKNVEALLPCIDLFVLPSLTEGTPMALLEAMASGIPVIATNVGGVPSIIENGVNGILVNPQSPGEIAVAIDKIINDEIFKTKLSNNGLETIRKKFGVKRWCANMENIYDSLVR